MLESDSSLRTDEVNKFRLTKTNHQFFNWWFFYDAKRKKKEKNLQGKILAGFKSY